ncbi:MAG: hypothetical protein DWI24_04040 [Planctomycetota bacterium]|nr:MAG: hypothetical protein DWI24_04040 [Planctomycetota bacterium]
MLQRLGHDGILDASAKELVPIIARREISKTGRWAIWTLWYRLNEIHETGQDARIMGFTFFRIKAG